jgi:hypothetical protein
MASRTAYAQGFAVSMAMLLGRLGKGRWREERRTASEEGRRRGKKEETTARAA